VVEQGVATTDGATSAVPAGGHPWRRRLLVIGGALLASLVLIQFVPYRVDNPPVVAEPNWDSPRTRQLAVAACYDCHSNETQGTWYENIAPVSWWITNHVEDGRKKLNFSEWNTRHGEAGDAVETVKNGSMPPSYYTWFGLHSGAKLTAKEKQDLADGLKATYAQSK
jgi:hypothetical protein